MTYKVLPFPKKKWRGGTVFIDARLIFSSLKSPFTATTVNTHTDQAFITSYIDGRNTIHKGKSHIIFWLNNNFSALVFITIFPKIISKRFQLLCLQCHCSQKQKAGCNNRFCVHFSLV